MDAQVIYQGSQTGIKVSMTHDSKTGKTMLKFIRKKLKNALSHELNFC